MLAPGVGWGSGIVQAASCDRGVDDGDDEEDNDGNVEGGMRTSFKLFPLLTPSTPPVTEAAIVVVCELVSVWASDERRLSPSVCSFD